MNNLLHFCRNWLPAVGCIQGQFYFNRLRCVFRFGLWFRLYERFKFYVKIIVHGVVFHIIVRCLWPAGNFNPSEASNFESLRNEIIWPILLDTGGQGEMILSNTNCIDALDIKTGRMLGYIPLVNNDNHDWDVDSVAAEMKAVLWPKQSNASKIMIYGL